MLGVGVFSVLSLLPVEFLPTEFLKRTAGWVLETGWEGELLWFFGSFGGAEIP